MPAISSRSRPQRSSPRPLRPAAGEDSLQPILHMDARSRPASRRSASSPLVSTPLDSPTPQPARGPAPAVRPSSMPFHRGLFLSTLFLIIASVLMIYSASSAVALDNHGDANYFLIRQIGFTLVGLGLLIGASIIPAAAWRKLVWVIYVLAIGGLIATEFSPLGLEMGGVKRWLRLGPLQFQFSELAKIALIGVLAAYWCRRRQATHQTMAPWLGAAALTVLPALLVFMQPHLSAAAVLVGLLFLMTFFAGVPLRQWLTVVGPLMLFVFVVVVLCRYGNMPFLKPYQQERIAAHFFADKVDDQGVHYQVLQGQRALVRGGVLGAGPGGSLYKQGYLPAPHTDFIMAVIGEECGLAGLGVLLLAYTLMVFFCIHTGHACEHHFDAMFCAGVGSLLGLQVLGNALVVCGKIPVTGMPLPLISYGGSGLLCTLLGVGIVLSISRQTGADEALPAPLPRAARPSQRQPLKAAPNPV